MRDTEDVEGSRYGGERRMNKDAVEKEKNIEEEEASRNKKERGRKRVK